MQHTATKETWWVAYNDDYFHFGKLEIGQEVSTGLSNLETFDTEEEMINQYPQAVREEEI